MRAASATLAAIVAPLILAAPAGARQLARLSLEEPHMGTTFRIVAYAPDAASGRVAMAEAFATVHRLDSLLSDYRDDSEIAWLAARAGEGPQPISPELHEVLTSALGWACRSGGAFDPTVGPLTRLWRWSSRRGELPSGARLATARARVGWQAVTLWPGSPPHAALARAGMSLDLGGIAKGYAADAALGVLARHGIASALVDAGGDVVAGAAPPGTAGWRVRAPGGTTLLIEHRAVATSGDAHRWLEVDGVRYSHIVDPRTGLGVRDAVTVTVMASDGATADALASAVTVLGPEAGEVLVSGVRGASIVRQEGPVRSRSAARRRYQQEGVDR